MRHLLIMLALGGALLAVKTAWAPIGATSRPALVVEVPASATGAEVQRAIDETLLVEQGIGLGWARTDPVIRQRLVANLRFAGAEGSPEELLARALALGMHRTDPVARQRLVGRAKGVLAQGGQPPGEHELRGWMGAHPQRYARPARWRLAHVFLREAGTDPRPLPDDPEAASALGDPLPGFGPRLEGSLDELERRLGPGFGRAVAEAPRGRWHGPISSAWGVHWVRVDEVRPSDVPPLHVVRARVEADWREAHRGERLDRRLRALRERYAVAVERIP